MMFGCVSLHEPRTLSLLKNTIYFLLIELNVLVFFLTDFSVIGFFRFDNQLIGSNVE
jgi:hypothetical protein